MLAALQTLFKPAEVAEKHRVASFQYESLRRRLEFLFTFEQDLRDLVVRSSPLFGERTMRGPAMGRRNWFFAGSDEGAERTAIICTVLESAARHGLDLRLYLRDVLMKIAGGWPQSRLDELLPHRWRELHADAVRASDLAATPPVSAAA